MKNLLFIIVMFLSSIVVGQTKTDGVQFRGLHENYTWRLKSKAQLDSFYFNLDPISTSIYNQHIRISLSGQIIDLFSIDGDSFNGLLTNTVTQYSNEKEKYADYKTSVAKRKYFETIALDSKNINEVVKTFFDSKLLEVPTDSLIPNWNKGFLHCNLVHVEHKINGLYFNKEYYCIHGQADSVRYKTLLMNYELLQPALNLDSLKRSFINKLPRGKSYSFDGYQMIYLLTKSELAGWNKSAPEREYLKSMKDSIDQFINNHLALEYQKQQFEDANCFDEYYLFFSAKGKFQKITISKDSKPSLKYSLGFADYINELKQLHKCKAQIKQVIKNIDMSSLHLQYDFYRSIRINLDGGYLLTDSMIY